ncbi:HMG domain-containing protein 4a isoform X1 [Carassius auratus]|uniref:HMG box-containing protein 4-like isoform X1 n=1 Tax=Carassius auratus TaxID=7957 RepID=A0A6P6JUG1_CARAU|nr:HMG box-containing protein 4-like isoform X1 [Carassius auratus]XP_026063360.1 HMG box-containing protein 4-like isoform X1 [Carassius auratus]XP_026063361.1 HMG box-containing protein 4-like isoform X1 [Carassius auratus]XP_026063362.1 HMG box-containing protein 4-like isoform X1 [Carassius auratus]XP_026063363.1 HMG box-containing protein 4-like isoform X1 [Carassius auratus]
MTLAFEEIKKKGMMDISGMEGEVGLVAGRSQREKRRSYKDLLREEEEIAAQVRKTSKKHHKDSDLFLLGGDSHKKKKKHSSDDHYHRDHHSSGQPPHKKKRKSSDRSPSLSSSSSSHPSHSTDTAMGLLEAITSPLATGSDPAPHLHKKPSYPPQASSHSSKDRKRDNSSKSSHSYSHSRPPGSSSSKKHSSSSKSLLFHGGAGKGEPLTLCDAEGLKMKLVLSSKEKNEGVGMNEGFSFPKHSSYSSGVVGHHSSSSSKKGIKKEKDKDKMMPKTPKKKQHSREPLPVVGKEVEVVGHYGGMGRDSSSSGGELEAGELVIDDSYTHLSKKKKKSKKSKKKKERERDREKGSREKKHSRGGSGGKKSCPGDPSRSHSHSQSLSNHSSSGGMYAMAPPTSPHHHQSIELVGEKKKKEEKDRDKHDKDKPKKKNMTAYQVFCKEYRVNINAEQPGLVFGELSKKLAEVWKQLPEKDKLVWRQKAQYLQHKQNKAEAMTVKRKTLTTSDSKSKGPSKAVSLGAVLAPQGRSSLSLSPVRVPDVDPIDAAAHLQLLGESLSLIGHRLQETEGMVAVSGSLSVLLDSILCALGPLTCLTAQVPQLNGCPRNILSNTLDNIAYIMPGL